MVRVFLFVIFLSLPDVTQGRKGQGCNRKHLGLDKTASQMNDLAKSMLDYVIKCPFFIRSIKVAQIDFNLFFRLFIGWNNIFGD